MLVLASRFLFGNRGLKSPLGLSCSTLVLLRVGPGSFCVVSFFIMKKKPEQTTKTKAALEDAFWELYTCEPLEKITVSAVCKLAGYSRGTFYAHYQDVYQLLEGIEQRFLNGMLACVERCMLRLAGDGGKLARVAALADVVAYYEKNKRHIVVLLSEQGDPAFLLRLKQGLKPLWRQYVIDDVGEHTEQEIDLILEYTLTGTLFMISRWLSNPGDISKAQMGHLIYDAAIRDVGIRVAS